jgi:hypothetical protein
MVWLLALASCGSGGAFCMETLDSEGGWLASPVDLVRLMGALAGTLLRPERIVEMTERRTLPEFGDGNTYYGLGIFVTVSGGDWWWHGGSLPGGGAFVARAPDGVAVALLVSTRGDDVNAFQDELTALGFALFATPFEGSPADLYPLFD